MSPNPKHIFSPSGLCKLVELAIGLILVLMTRLGGPDHSMLSVGETVDADAFAYMTVFGYFFITCVQVLGIILGEEMNFQNLTFAFLGCIFHLATGGIQIDGTYSDDPNKSVRYAMGAMCLIQGIVYLLDVGAMAWQVKRDRD